MISRRVLYCSRQGGHFVTRPLLKQAPSRGLISLPKRGDRLRAAILLSGPVITFCLGVWQVKRLFWKRDLIDRLHRLLNEEPLRLDVLVERDEDLGEVFERLPEYRKVRVCGRFDHSREIYIRPRPRVDRKGASTGASGALVVTPFILSSQIYPQNLRGTWILVNRGWVDYAHMDPATRPEGQVGEELEMFGVVRKSERRLSSFVLKEICDEKNLVWSQRNVEKMAQVLGTARLFIDAENTVPGGPLAGQTIVSVRDQHLNYIITWFSLSVATGYIWFRTFIKP